MRLLRDPTLHFCAVWLTAPIFALVGTSLNRPSNALSASLAGWFLTLSLWSAFGIRSVVYQWKALPHSSEGRWPDLSRTTGIELRILVSVSLVTLFSFLAALIVFGLLTVQCFRGVLL